MIARTPQSAAIPGLSLARTLLLTAAVAALPVAAAAQGRGPGNGGMGMGGMGGGISVGRSPLSNETRSLPGPTAESHGGLRLGLPGRWWDDKQLARTIGLDSGQQKRMDDVFGANRETLLQLYKNLQHEESQLAKLSRSRELDENQIYQQIDRVTQARGEAEKAYAHMLLQIRKEMTPQQVGKMDEILPPPAQ
jgi:Spy/CpxP family protein refolding chaperone